MVTFRKSEFSDSHSMHSTSSRPNKYQSPSSLTIPAANKQGKGLHFNGVKTAVAIIRQQKQELQPPLRGPMSMCKPNVHPDLHSSVNSHLNHSSYFNPKAYRANINKTNVHALRGMKMQTFIPCPFHPGILVFLYLSALLLSFCQSTA